MQTIATTKSGWEAKIYYIGKAQDLILSIENGHKNRATSAGTEITQEFQKNIYN